ncbi:Hypothetical protein ORPV_674 [Orpheovirus IHUMI-LCC2]|uniref:Uncharacterized protein n=1 Tax=Orpheovirus IHUMI-LCC2 TaxID=2023057 RepID=A0A2I2L4V6_9VIRU|nr:Hypothetical protein ORPV_674 [Orpheovirus IHUMI-LCC2]SNW62578.1 Hypothetical protein ORPV_674 [Orpheovirus IHUMI-LCC2]
MDILRVEFDITLHAYMDGDYQEKTYPTGDVILDAKVKDYLRKADIVSYLYPLSPIGGYVDNNNKYIAFVNNKNNMIDMELLMDGLVGASPFGNAPDDWMEGNISIGSYKEYNNIEVIPIVVKLYYYEQFTDVSKFIPDL